MNEMQQKGCFYQNINIAAAAAGAGAIASIPNPEGADLIVTRLLIRTTNAGAGATQVDAGPAAGANVLNDTLLDGVAINAVGLVDNIKDKAAAGNAVEAVIWPANQFLTVSKSGGNAGSEIGIQGTVYVEYIRA